MAEGLSLDELLAKQRAMSEVAVRLADEKDPERIQQIAAELKRVADDLQAAAERIAAATPGAAAHNFTEVVLTDPQRERVAAATGVRLESIKLSDPAGVATRTMPHSDPRIIEHYAMQEASRQKAAAEANALLRQQLDASIADIKSQGTPAVLDQLERLKADPNFLNGLFKK